MWPGLPREQEPCEFDNAWDWGRAWWQDPILMTDPLWPLAASGVPHTVLILVEMRPARLPRWFSGKESVCQRRRRRRLRFDSWVRKMPWRMEWQPTLVFLPGKSHGQRSLAGYSPWGCKDLDKTEWLSMCEYAHETCQKGNILPS